MVIRPVKFSRMSFTTSKWQLFNGENSRHEEKTTENDKKKDKTKSIFLNNSKGTKLNISQRMQIETMTSHKKCEFVCSFNRTKGKPNKQN